MGAVGEASMEPGFHQWVGTELIDAAGPVPADCLEGATLTALLFGSQGGGQLQGAVDAVRRFYDAIKASPQRDELQVVFVSNDPDQASFDQAFNGMPWLAIPFSENRTREKLFKVHQVEGVGFEVLAKDCTCIPQEGDNAFNPDAGVTLLNNWKRAAKPGNWMDRAFPDGALGGGG